MSWEQKRLMEICNPKQWKTISMADLKVKGFPVYGANGKIGFYDQYTHLYPTLLITCRGATCGELNICEPKSYVNGNAMAIDSLDPKVDLYFLKYYFKHRGFQDIISGSAQPQITRIGLSKIVIPLPPLETQQKIAAILDKADELVQNDKKILEKYDQLAQSVFLEMFGDPGSQKHKFELTTLGEACYFIKDGPHVSPKYVTEGVPFISVNNIIHGTWDLNSVRYISRKDHELFKKRCNPEKGDVLYTKGGTTGFAKYIDIDLEFSNWVHLAVLKFEKDIINGIFLEHMLNSRFCYLQSQLYTRGIANRDLVLSQMKRIKILLPPIELQNRFAEIIKHIETQKQVALQSLQKSEELFLSLLQGVFRAGGRNKGEGWDGMGLK